MHYSYFFYIKFLLINFFILTIKFYLFIRFFNLIYEQFRFKLTVLSSLFIICDSILNFLKNGLDYVFESSKVYEKLSFGKLVWCILVKIILKYHFQHYLTKPQNSNFIIYHYFFGHFYFSYYISKLSLQ